MLFIFIYEINKNKYFKSGIQSWNLYIKKFITEFIDKKNLIKAYTKHKISIDYIHFINYLYYTHIKFYHSTITRKPITETIFLYINILSALTQYNTTATEKKDLKKNYYSRKYTKKIIWRKQKHLCLVSHEE